MKGRAVVHSSESDEWLTPPELFEPLHAKWRFDTDPCASPAGRLSNFIDGWDITKDGLRQSWEGRRLFVNPPYSNIGDWVAKACSVRDLALIVMLIPARTDTKYWHSYIKPNALAVDFLKGRIKFTRGDGAASTSAPFPSCLVYF